MPLPSSPCSPASQQQGAPAPSTCAGSSKQQQQQQQNELQHSNQHQAQRRQHQHQAQQRQHQAQRLFEGESCSMQGCCASMHRTLHVARTAAGISIFPCMCDMHAAKLAAAHVYITCTITHLTRGWKASSKAAMLTQCTPGQWECRCLIASLTAAHHSAALYGGHCLGSADALVGNSSQIWHNGAAAVTSAICCSCLLLMLLVVVVIVRSNAGALELHRACRGSSAAMQSAIPAAL